MCWTFDITSPIWGLCWGNFEACFKASLVWGPSHLPDPTPPGLGWLCWLEKTGTTLALCELPNLFCLLLPAARSWVQPVSRHVCMVTSILDSGGPCSYLPSPPLVRSSLILLLPSFSHCHVRLSSTPWTAAARPSCPSLSPRICPSSCPLSLLSYCL